MITLQNGKPRIPPLASEPLGFGQKHDATVDIPLDTMNVRQLLFSIYSCSISEAWLNIDWYGILQDSKQKAKELSAWEADLKRREKVDFTII